MSESLLWSAYLAVPNEEKWRWVSKLLFFVIISGQDTYNEVGAGLKDPPRMRIMNELSHRIASYLFDLAVGTVKTPAEPFLLNISQQLKVLGIDQSKFLKNL